MSKNSKLFLQEREIEAYNEERILIEAEIWEGNFYGTKGNKHHVRRKKKKREAPSKQYYSPKLPF